MNVLLVALVVGAACLSGCRHVEPGEDGFGAVTVSTPLFTPLTDAIGEGKRLSFGDLRDEQKLAEAIHKPGLGISYLEYEALKTAVAANIAGPQLSSTDTTTTKIDAAKVVEERTKERKRTFESPDVPTAPTPETAGDAQAKLLALLERSATKYQLPPGDVAALVAAYKTYMVNLEEYYNVESYRDIFGGVNAKWLPYKVHFTVSAQPGWYTRNHDATAKLTFGDCSKFRVLTVIPPETSQTLEELGALLRSVATSAELGGAFQAVAVQAQVDHIKAVAQRLEGLKTNTTVIAGYPAPNQTLIRFRPSVTPNLNTTYDLQPTSHVMTALVLVSDEAAGTLSNTEQAAIAKQLSVNTTDVKTTLRVTRDATIVPPVRAGVTKGNVAPASGAKRTVFPSRAQPADGALRVRGAAPQEGPAIELPVQPSPNVPTPGSCDILIQSEFAVNQKPRPRFVLSRNPPTLPALTCSKVSVDIPLWAEEGATPFSIAKAFGYYWADTPTGAARAVVGYQINNPTNLPVALWVSGTTDPTAESYYTIIGTGPQEGSLVVQVPPPAEEGANVRVFLHAALAQETTDAYVFSENKVLEVVLEPQARRPSRVGGSPAISVDAGGLHLQPVPVGNLPPDVLKALVGERKDVEIFIAPRPSPEGDGTGSRRNTAGPATRP